MAKCGKEIIIDREGTEQSQRYLNALDPSYFKLNDFGLKEWMQFAYQFAEQVNYFSTTDDQKESGNWQEFFKDESEISAFLESVEVGYTVTPHLALYVCFLKLIEITRGHFNKLTKRHLDFYYQKILKIGKQAATPDKVYVIFELAKNCAEAQIARDTELDGGKDSTGKKRIYKTTEELIANKINLAQIRSVYNDSKNKKIKAAEATNSSDGKGTVFPDDEIKWWPFGYYGDENDPELADAKLGFALSSEIFALSEGERNIQITIKFTESLSGLNTNQLLSGLKIYCSGEKKWLGPFSLQKNISSISGSGFATSAASATLKLAVQIGKDEKAVSNYQSSVLGESFNTELPVCRILFNTENEDGYSLLQKLAGKKIKEITVDIDVKGAKNVKAENDIGSLNVKKPFYPFGTQPVKRSNFYIGFDELFKKEWKQIEIELDWKNTPEKISGSSLDAFVNLYYAYRKENLYQASPNSYLNGILTFNGATNHTQSYTVTGSPTNLIVDSNDYFKATVEVLNKEEWDPIDTNLILFTDNESAFKTNLSISNTGYETKKNGPVRLSLNQTFLHELFPRIYALALSSTEGETLVPNEPYTPLIESITINYRAQTKITLGSTETDYAGNELKLFHEYPFGQSEEHPFLKSQLSFLGTDAANSYLIPKFGNGGELYLGFENATNLQTVSMLVQLLEGSENPEADSQKTEWFVLCKNQWKNLDSTSMILNETDNFLKSGIVRFSIPTEATNDNTLLPNNLIWVKATNNQKYDTVCKAISIQTQAVLAEFSDNGNELSHLSTGLTAKSISKLVQRVSTVKSILQPYNSFNGIPEESDPAYYRRISERLRHKNRAISAWDYEAIILQQFPDIQKAKCLNHSSETSFLSPGNVLIVVIPDIVNKNVFDMYQPRVSKATLNAIQEFVNQQNTLHVTAKVINPDYEEVTIELKAKFYSGFDENYYLKVLNDDIIRFLSPWAFEKTTSIEFSTTLHRSVLINYLEKLDYVDFVEDVKLKKGEEISTTSLTPSSPKAILVSARLHSLSIVTENCTVTSELLKKCQQ
ncbi:MAG TPA: baseplate J/gp47 family protein [Prolixibacteraceae bacterium]|nr:baseplate J/gp47 family protein [Prolixibacteraceae bacterium]